MASLRSRLTSLSTNCALPFKSLFQPKWYIHFCVLLLISQSSSSQLPPSTANVTDLIVNIGENVLLECSDLPVVVKPFYDHAHDEEESIDSIDPIERRRSGRYIHHAATTYKYIWCRYEEDWVRGVSYRTLREAVLEQSTAEPNRPFLRYKTCFEGDRYFVANEGKVSTVVYRCGTVRRDTGHIVANRLWKLYVDQFATVAQKRDTTTAYRTSPSPSSPVTSSAHGYRCAPPRCKPYASVLQASCSLIELHIRYPTSQYGYNDTSDYWGTVSCADQVTGYQLWLIGYGIVKKFRTTDRIIMDNLLPGKRYCFNGWAFNGCGSGPVFTLEGVCAANSEGCNTSSDEHCELDVDYSY